MTAWIENDCRVDIELAVALEVGVLCLVQAGPQQTAKTRALEVNRRLWRAIGAMAAKAPMAEDRQALTQTAQRVTAGQGIESGELVILNTRHAGQLAGRAATQGALGHLMADWRAYRLRHRGAVFVTWIVERVEAFCSHNLPEAA